MSQPRGFAWREIKALGQIETHLGIPFVKPKSLNRSWLKKSLCLSTKQAAWDLLERWKFHWKPFKEHRILHPGIEVCALVSNIWNCKGIRNSLLDLLCGLSICRDIWPWFLFWVSVGQEIPRNFYPDRVKSPRVFKIVQMEPCWHPVLKWLPEVWPLVLTLGLIIYLGRPG